MKTPLTQALNKESRCKYWLPDQSYQAEYSCEYEMVDIDIPYCIFHLPTQGEDTFEQLTSQSRQKVIDIREQFASALKVHVERKQMDEKEQIIDCRGFRFPAYVFEGSFGKHMDFSYATFEDIIFSVDVDYASEVRRPFIFNQGATFSYSTFKGEARFSEVRFKAESYFAYVTFNQHADFESTHFEGDVSFAQTLFKDFTVFSDSTFLKSVTFLGSDFSGFVGFSRARFHQRATFMMLRFKNGVVFDAAKFYQDVSFQEAIFDQGATLRDTAFLGPMSFARATFDEKILFREVQFEATTTFTGVDILKDANVTFEKVNLGKVSFADTNLELITFRDVTWTMPNSRFRPFALWDEFRPEDKSYRRDYEKIAENYRQLVINYEKKRDYDFAEIFHIGEMETRRKKKGDKWRYKPPVFRWVKKWFNTHGLYRLSSTYGTNYWQATLVLASLIILFSLSFLYAGFETERQPSRLIQYNIVPNRSGETVSATQWAKDFVEAVSFSLSIITFQQERFYKPIGLASTLLLYGAVIMLTAQLAMVVLAVRRTFKR